MNLEPEILKRIRGARRVAVLTGAGISSESGIPTFRGEGGLWRNYRAEDLATPGAFARDPQLVWDWYDMRRSVCAAAEPNAAHLTVATMEQQVEEFLLITQNVDGLHARAGSKKLCEIHGNLWTRRCTNCGLTSPLKEVPLQRIPPLCPECQGVTRPNVVWFGESYDVRLLETVMRFLHDTELLFVVGTSGMVSMPVHLASLAVQSGALVIDVNVSDSAIADLAALCLRGPAGVVLPDLWKSVRD